MYCASFSKTLTPGYRVGWCVPGRYRNEIMAQMFSRNLSVSSIAQAVLAEFLGRKYLKPHIESLQKRFAENSRFLHDLVQNAFPASTRHHPPPGGFIHWLELPDHIDMNRLLNDALQQGCQISHNGIFFPDGKSTQAIRICFGRALTPDVIQALHALARCARNQPTPCP
ncbi:MAG: aminotransferase class I/II-fold pyridoxal phosphate-dependent enzyme [Lautropia sp.]|nr:aminotransferase class I/II-fold pyridoxal phosphate-dependent enzyme [Lautropia sp.]